MKRSIAHPMRARVRRVALPALAVIAVAACAGEPPAAGQIPERTFIVETAPSELRDIRVTVDVVGTIAASEEAELRTQVDALLAAVRFEEGATVNQGERLFELDDRKARARLALAEAARDSSEARKQLTAQRLQRQKRLFADKLISPEEFERAQTEHSEAEANMREQTAAVQLAERELEEFYIDAPFSGRVGQRLIDVGNYVSKGTALAVLVRADPIQVDFNVPDRFAGKVRVGTAVDISPSHGGPHVEGTVDFVDPRIDVSTRMLSARASVANPEGLFLPGQFAQLSVLVEERIDQITIPEEAVLSAAGATWVFVVVDGVAKRRGIELGERLPPIVEVRSGVDAGDTIVVGGQHRLKDGARVQSPETAAAGS